MKNPPSTIAIGHQPLAMVSVLVVPLLLLVSALLAQSQTADPMLARIRSEGLEHSQVTPVFETLTIEIGPRLTASPAHKRAAEFVRERLAAYGLTNAHLEPWTFGAGWTLEKLTVDLVEPRYLPLIGYADAWSPSTAGELVGAPLWLPGKTLDEIQALKTTGQLKGAIVMTMPMMTNFVRRDRPQPSDPSYVPGSAAYATSAGRAATAGALGRGAATTPGRGRGADPTALQISQILRENGAGVFVRPSTGEHGTVFVTGVSNRATAPTGMPTIVVSGEHYNMIARMLEHHVPVKLRVNVQTKYYEGDGNAYNVIAELPGTDPALEDEVVMIGGHLDSWHTGVGATDNADGSTTVIEAMRILHAIGARPRRTIRVALWGGEEQGLLGSKAWIEQHLAGDANRAARERFDVYFNIDNGTGPIYGWYLENSEAVRPIFDAWLEPLKDLGARRNVIEPVGSTDHVSFNTAGVPGFNPIQDYVGYDVRTHHTNMDTVERVKQDEIKQAAIVMATFAYQAAMSDQKIPRSGRSSGERLRPERGASRRAAERERAGVGPREP